LLIRYSQIDTFVNCPMMYYRKYILNDVPFTTSDALEFGSALHLAIKTIFDGEDPYALWDVYWNSVKEKDLKYAYNMDWDKLNLLAKNTFLPNFIRLHQKKFADLKNEQQMEVPFYEHTLQGTLDAVGMYEGKLSVIDWKTSGYEYPKAKIIRNPQMYMYAFMHHATTGQMPEQLVYKVFIKRDGRIQTLTHPITEKDVAKMMKNVYTIINSMEFMTKQNHWYCNFNNKYCLGENGCE
jgi:hypothetical protein